MTTRVGQRGESWGESDPPHCEALDSLNSIGAMGLTSVISQGARNEFLAVKECVGNMCRSVSPDISEEKLNNDFWKQILQRASWFFVDSGSSAVAKPRGKSARPPCRLHPHGEEDERPGHLQVERLGPVPDVPVGVERLAEGDPRHLGRESVLQRRRPRGCQAPEELLLWQRFSLGPTP